VAAAAAGHCGYLSPYVSWTLGGGGPTPTLEHDFGLLLGSSMPGREQPDKKHESHYHLGSGRPPPHTIYMQVADKGPWPMCVRWNCTSETNDDRSTVGTKNTTKSSQENSIYINTGEKMNITAASEFKTF
jgi:hypothetical protein